MRARPGRNAGSRPRAAGKAKRPGRRWLPGALGVALVLGVALAGTVLWRIARAPRAPASADPSAGMSIGQAGRAAARLYRAQRAYESLPYYRRVAPTIPAGRLDFGLEFSSALQIASLQERVRSQDRVHLMRESLARLDATERAASRPRERARVLVDRAFYLRIWGFPSDALIEIRRALAIDPSYPGLASNVRALERWVREPTTPFEALHADSLPELFW